MAEIDFPLPTEAARQQLAAVVYAEASVGNTSDQQAEKHAIALCFVNMAYYAVLKKPDGKNCYNSSFGNGTVLGAISRASAAYGGARWNEIMSGDAMKSKPLLEAALDAGKVEHLRRCVLAVSTMPIAGGPFTLSSLGDRIPVQFNQAQNAPPSPRQEKIGRLSSHTFYAFKAGRECE